jgi:hypothetical protein
MEGEALRLLTRHLGRPEPEAASAMSDEPIPAIDLLNGFLTERSNRYEYEHHRAAQEQRERAIAATRRRILAELWRRNGAYRRKQAEYHTELARKYRNAARYP